MLIPVTFIHITSFSSFTSFSLVLFRFYSETNFLSHLFTCVWGVIPFYIYIFSTLFRIVEPVNLIEFFDRSQNISSQLSYDGACSSDQNIKVKKKEKKKIKERKKNREIFCISIFLFFYYFFADILYVVCMRISLIFVNHDFNFLIPFTPSSFSSFGLHIFSIFSLILFNKCPLRVTHIKGESDVNSA